MTHWSSRLLADHLGVDASTVLRTWRHHRVQPAVETFKFSTDPELVAKVTDVVGLYLNPPENAIVLSIDEKSQIQALNRPRRRCRCNRGRPRNAPTITSGTAPRPCSPHSRSLRGQVTGGANRGTGTMSSGGVPAPRCPRLPRPATAPDHGQLRRPQASEGEGLAGGEPQDPYPLHLTSGSWLNLVEVWFSIIERQAIHRGAFPSVRDLMIKIRAFINGWNDRCQPFVWTKTADQIPTKVNRKQLQLRSTSCGAPGLLDS